jgi:hypothetical protein
MPATAPLSPAATRAGVSTPGGDVCRPAAILPAGALPPFIGPRNTALMGIHASEPEHMQTKCLVVRGRVQPYGGAAGPADH